MSEMVFSEVIPTQEQVEALYDLLLRREHRISHQTIPPFEEHLAFVESHPYRAWYIVYRHGRASGSFYVSSDNTLGINLLEAGSAADVAGIICHVKKKYAPLPAIKSVRNAIFTINVSPANTELLDSLQETGAKVLQLTYSLEPVRCED